MTRLCSVAHASMMLQKISLQVKTRTNFDGPVYLVRYVSKHFLKRKLGYANVSSRINRLYVWQQVDIVCLTTWNKLIYSYTCYSLFSM